MEPTSPVAVSASVATYVDGTPDPGITGQGVFVLRCAHLDTGAVMEVEIPAGSGPAIYAVAQMGEQIDELLAHALANIGDGSA